MADDTPVAILTNPQREFLRGEREPTQERTMRTRIRERVRASFADLALLADTLPEMDDWELLFDDFKEYTDWIESGQSDERRLGRPGDWVDENRQIARGFHGAVLLTYLAVGKHAGEMENFENVIETAVELAETTPTERAVVSAEVDLSHEPRPAELIEKFQEGDPLTEEEYETLLEAGELDPMELLKREGVIVDPDDKE